VNEDSQTQTANVVSADINNAVSVGSDGGAYKKFAAVNVYNTAIGSSSLTNSFTAVNLPETRTNIGSFAVSSSDVTVPVNGVYELTYSVSYDFISIGFNNNSRTIVETILVNGNTEIPGTKGYSYHRNGGSGEGTATQSIILSLNANEAIGLRARRQAGIGNIRSQANACNLTIKLLN
jgi:hypothetical protein